MRIFKISVAFVGTLLLFAGCNGGEGDGEEGVKVGAVLSLSGQYSNYGNSIRNGVEIALEEFNADGGISGAPLEVAVKDSGSSAEGARAAMADLVSEGCDIVIGAETTELTKELIPIAAREEIVLISPSATSPSLRRVRSGGFFFRICPTDDAEAVKIAEDLPRRHPEMVFVKRPFMRAFAFVRRQNDYAIGLWQAFSDYLRAGELVRYDHMFFNHDMIQAEPGEDGEYNEQMKEILARAGEYQLTEESPANLGAVVIFGMADDVEMLLRAFAREGLQLQVYASSSVDVAEFFESASDVAESLVFPRIFDPGNEESPMVSRFVSQYRSKHGKDPDLYAAYGYDAAMLLGLTLRRENIAGQLKQPRNLRLQMNDERFNGLTGRVDFSHLDNEVIKTFLLYRMTKGGPVELTEYESELLSQKVREMEQLRR